MIPEHFLKKPITFSQDLSSGALSYTTTIGRNFKLERIIFSSDVAITETIRAWRISKNGSAYDGLLMKRSLVNSQYQLFRPDGEENYVAGEEVRVTCTNANTTGVISGEIHTSEM